MKNVTISMDEELAQLTRVAAAKEGKSMSRFVADMLAERVQTTIDKDDTVNRQLQALERIFNGPKWDISEKGRMPAADERNARR